MHTRAPLAPAFGATLLLFFTTPAFAEDDFNWQKGPMTATLGKRVATVNVPTEYVFADAAETRKIMTAMGNTVDNTEVGMISPAGEDWFLIFEYKPEGYVKDDDRDEIDKDAILESYRNGTEEGNKRRQELGRPALHVTGWFEEPHYDLATHNLVWALNAKSDDGSEIVNYNVRVLGREGFMSVTLVDEPAKMAATKPRFDQILSTFTYSQGKTYAEWRPGDKVAQYGLVALVAGGAGAAAAKMGLFAVFGKFLAKAGKAVVLLLVAAAAGLQKLWRALTGRRQVDAEQAEP